MRIAISRKSIYLVGCMGWGFRRSINLGPLRINASKSGLGYSFGGRGFRIGRDAKGRSYTSTSIPGTGIYNRSYSRNVPKQRAPRYTSSSQGNTAIPNGKQFSGRKLATAAAYVAAGTAIYLLVSWCAHLL